MNMKKILFITIVLLSVSCSRGHNGFIETNEGRVFDTKIRNHDFLIIRKSYIHNPDCRTCLNLQNEEL
jgi:hypothetical protein